MRRKEKEITDKALLEEILERSQVCRLGIVDGDEAYIVPVSYAWHEGIIYIHSAPEGRKMDLLRKNGRVSFEIELESRVVRDAVPCRWTTRYRSVMGTGTITIHEEEAEKKAGLDLIMHKYGYHGRPRYSKKDLAGMVLLKLKIETLTGKQAGE